MQKHGVDGMNKKMSWQPTDIQLVNNFLIIKGSELFKSSHDPNRVYRACYALPSDPHLMDDWVSTHLSENEAAELFEFLNL